MKLSKSGIFLIVVLVIAIGLSAWVTVMTCNVLTKEPITTPSRASSGDTPQSVQPIEKPKEPDTLVISMVGDCTLASIQTGRDFDSYIDKNGTSWPFSGVLELSEQGRVHARKSQCSFSGRGAQVLFLFYFRGQNHRMLTFSCRAVWSASRSATTTRMTSARKERRRHEVCFGCSGCCLDCRQ